MCIDTLLLSLDTVSLLVDGFSCPLVSVFFAIDTVPVMVVSAHWSFAMDTYPIDTCLRGVVL